MSEPEKKYPVTFMDEFRRREKYQLVITVESKPYNDFIVVIGTGPVPSSENYERRKLVSRNRLLLMTRLRWAKNALQREYDSLLSVSNVATPQDS